MKTQSATTSSAKPLEPLAGVDPTVWEQAPYLIGLDLGTTNCALSYIDRRADVNQAALHDPQGQMPVVATFAILQLVAAGEVAAEPLLPSFIYQPTSAEVDPVTLRLPWQEQNPRAIGRHAREAGALVPTRLIASAKSWLSQSSVDRRGAILPWLAEDDYPKISPVQATAAILQHLASAWNYTMAQTEPAARLESLPIVLTVPASFDAIARELTLEAAQQAGLRHLILLEEPQAAFYAWIHQAGTDWRQTVRRGDVILVIDVGGGTSDFTLISIGETDGNLTLERLAVGDHLLVGGDNMDLTLANHLAQSLRQQNQRLDAHQMLQLIHQCRRAKETLLTDTKAGPQSIVVHGRGRKLVGGTLRAELQPGEAESILRDGFFPLLAADAEPQSDSGLGLQELGLQYEADPAITRHLAAFLRRHQSILQKSLQLDDKQPAPNHGIAIPTAVLFNGGVFHAVSLRQRVFEVLHHWSGLHSTAATAPIAELRELPTAHLDQAVARGAAYYAWVRQHAGLRIRGGVPRSYYIGIETAMPAVPGIPRPLKALCVVPQGMEEGTQVKLENRQFRLIVDQPARFRFLTSNQRRDDRVGVLVEEWEETITEIDPIEITLSLQPKETSANLAEETAKSPKSAIPVKLHSHVTEIGTLELWLQAEDGQQWKLEYNVREPAQTH